MCQDSDVFSAASKLEVSQWAIRGLMLGISHDRFLGYVTLGLPMSLIIISLSYVLQTLNGVPEHSWVMTEVVFILVNTTLVVAGLRYSAERHKAAAIQDFDLYCERQWYEWLFSQDRANIEQ